MKIKRIKYEDKKSYYGLNDFGIKKQNPMPKIEAPSTLPEGNQTINNSDFLKASDEALEHLKHATEDYKQTASDFSKRIDELIKRIEVLDGSRI